jgi:two-component system CheB/CheR fusion protein
MPSLVAAMANHERVLPVMDSETDENVLADFRHRVKNLMAVVRSIARRTAQNALSLEEFADHFDGRLATLTRTFRILSRTNAFDVDLEELVREELLSQAAGDRVTAEGPSLRLTQNAAEALGLAIHELAVNAVKYGALAGDGNLSITWNKDEAGLHLVWRESGVRTVEPTHRGFGREWIEQGLPYQLKASTSLEFLPGGVVCTILVPANQIGGVP